MSGGLPAIADLALCEQEAVSLNLAEEAISFSFSKRGVVFLLTGTIYLQKIRPGSPLPALCLSVRAATAPKLSPHYFV